ncbi:histidinol dehydrogenase [Clostridia bacterium]|nr:histidinol dehydrogenase [Clostridia bacterium]
MIRIVTHEDASSFEIKRTAHQDVLEKVTAIVADIRENGDAALFSYSKKFDGVQAFEVPQADIEAAFENTDENFKRILTRAKDNITAYHALQKRTGFIHESDGVVMGQRIIPLERVGVYVPGGTSAYPSTVLMDAIPAKIAGVREIIMVSPPQKDGKLSADVLAAAKIAGVDRVFAMGGAHAIAALAYGTETVPMVDKIVGPGNIWVVTAKKLVYGQVGLDMVAGPSDILIIADNLANPAFVAADLLSQAEHGALSQAILITTSEALAKAVQTELSVQLAKLPRREEAEASLRDNGMIILTSSLKASADLANKIAPEHLELCVNEPFALLPLIKNAGSVFLGHFTPEALGDYMAGPNHTLPTEGTARFSSPLSVDDFCKKSSFLYYSKDAFNQIASDVAEFAAREGLKAHAESAIVRTKREG